jgi:hypothetical protein
LYRQIVSKLEFVDKRDSEKKSEVSVRFDISRGESKYKCMVSKTCKFYSEVLVKVFEIYTGEGIVTKEWWWGWGGVKK